MVSVGGWFPGFLAAELSSFSACVFCCCSNSCNVVLLFFCFALFCFVSLVVFLLVFAGLVFLVPVVFFVYSYMVFCLFTNILFDLK